MKTLSSHDPSNPPLQSPPDTGRSLRLPFPPKSTPAAGTSSHSPSATPPPTAASERYRKILAARDADEAFPTTAIPFNRPKSLAPSASARAAPDASASGSTAPAPNFYRSKTFAPSAAPPSTAFGRSTSARSTSTAFGRSARPSSTSPNSSRGLVVIAGKSGSSGGASSRTQHRRAASAQPSKGLPAGSDSYLGLLRAQKAAALGTSVAEVDARGEAFVCGFCRARFAFLQKREISQCVFALCHRQSNRDQERQLASQNQIQLTHLYTTRRQGDPVCKHPQAATSAPSVVEGAQHATYHGPCP